MSIDVNKKGLILYALTLAASLVSASYYGGPAVYVWLYAVLLLIPLSAVYILHNYRFLRIYQEIEVHKVTKGEDHQYKAIIENAGYLPIHRMRLYTFADRCNLYEIHDGQEISLDIREKKEIHSGISCCYAGSYCIGIERVSFTDPFEIYTVCLNVPYSFRAVVSPQITDIASSVLDLENLRNSTGLKSNRLVEDTPGSDLRRYQMGDPLSSINWKVSVKHSELSVRVPDKMEKRTVTILMQAANVPDNRQDTESLQKRDFFLEFVVSAAWHFADQGVPIRIIYPAGKISESTVDSQKSFMDFYSIVADGIFYSSEEEYRKIQRMAEERRGSVNDDGTWILIREDPEPGENYYYFCD